MLVAEDTNALNLSDEQFQMFVNKSVSIINDILETTDNEALLSMCRFEFTIVFYRRMFHDETRI